MATIEDFKLCSKAGQHICWRLYLAATSIFAKIDAVIAVKIPIFYTWYLLVMGDGPVLKRYAMF